MWVKNFGYEQEFGYEKNWVRKENGKEKNWVHKNLGTNTKFEYEHKFECKKIWVRTKIGYKTFCVRKKIVGVRESSTRGKLDPFSETERRVKMR